MGSFAAHLKACETDLEGFDLKEGSAGNDRLLILFPYNSTLAPGYTLMRLYWHSSFDQSLFNGLAEHTSW